MVFYYIQDEEKTRLCRIPASSDTTYSSLSLLHTHSPVPPTRLDPSQRGALPSAALVCLEHFPSSFNPVNILLDLQISDQRSRLVKDFLPELDQISFVLALIGIYFTSVGKIVIVVPVSFLGTV